MGGWGRLGFGGWLGVVWEGVVGLEGGWLWGVICFEGWLGFGWSGFGGGWVKRG